MTVLQIVFLFIAAGTLAAAALVVTVRNLFHAALWLVVTLFGVAVIFALLEANFLVAAQVALYIGAISILIIFAVMLTQGIMHTDTIQINRQAGLSAVVALGFFLGLWLILMQLPNFNQLSTVSVPADSLQQLGQAMVAPDQYALPFEVAAVLLLAAMVGSIMLARDKK
jgi:NADH:ubiquinone oxidoreductase subunit 6 (subunit J)